MGKVTPGRLRQLDPNAAPPEQLREIANIVDDIAREMRGTLTVAERRRLAEATQALAHVIRMTALLVQAATPAPSEHREDGEG